jgi:thymidylate synthase ThyX
MSEKFPRQIYLLSPKDLSPETIAVTFAKTSRSPLSFREIAEELTDEVSAEFHEKWVVGYGHSSVAEHAVLHIAFENVSRLAIECIESNRLASYTEKSTRYQRWDPSGYHTPTEVISTPFEKTYRDACNYLFKVYMDSLEPVRRIVQDLHPQKDGEDEERWDGRIRAKYVDACRYILPAAALANVGMTVNARALEIAIRKMLSHALSEVREIGEEVRNAANLEVPTLVRYAEAVPYLRDTQADLARRAAEIETEAGDDAVRLIAHDPSAELRVMAAAIYSHAGCAFDTAQAIVESMGEDERGELAEAILGRLERFDVPLRVLEHAVYTFDVRIDQGAYFELKRHRMMTQTAQNLTTKLGYAIPKLIVDAGYEEAYSAAMDYVEEAYSEIAAWNPQVASYLVPNAFNRRVLCTLNLREVFHLCELRSQPNAHFAMRRMAFQMAEKVGEIHPTLTAFLRLPEGETWRDVEKQHFSQV